MKECASPTPLIVMTIGHSTRSAKEFIHILKAHQVRRLVDVRTVPRSRHNPQFNRSELSTALHSARLHYRYMPGLGGFRRAHRDSLNTGWHNASFRGFADYMQTLLEAAGEGTKMADHLSPIFRPAFPSSAIISERSSPSRVRFAAPNNGAPLTAPGRSGQHF
jgi:hypothetical protein